jgi:hypothetical protein
MQSPSRSRELKSFWTITADDAEGRLARAMRTCVGNELKKMYGNLLSEPIPPRIAELMRRLD